MQTPALVILLIIIDVIGAKRSARRNLGKDRFRQAALAGIHFPRPRACPTAAVAHGCLKMWPRVKCKRREHIAPWQMVFERCAVGGCQWGSLTAMKVANEIALAITRYTIAEDEILRPATDVDRINLNETKVANCGGGTGHRRIEQQGTAMKTPGIKWREMEHNRHFSRLAMAAAVRYSLASSLTTHGSALAFGPWPTHLSNELLF